MIRYIGILLLTFALVDAASSEQELARYWDYNGDGKEDLRYEDAEDYSSYFEYLDRNFDGKEDYRTQYDAGSDWPIQGLSDDNFDGNYETRYIYQNAEVIAIVTDSSGDGNYDIAHYYEVGLITRSVKYSLDGGTPFLQTVTYLFGFPISTSRRETSETPSQFHKSLKSRMPLNQNMPLKPSNRVAGEVVPEPDGAND